MVENRTSWFDKLRYAHRHTDLLDKVIGVLVVVAIISVGFNLFQRYRSLDLLDVETPVLLTKEVYQKGELVEGIFNGEVKTDLQPKVTRALICDNDSYQLEDREATGGKRFLKEAKVGIVVLEDSQTQSGKPIRPGTNCFIKFTNIYTIDLPLGGTRTEQVRYFSDTFDIEE